MTWLKVMRKAHMLTYQHMKYRIYATNPFVISVCKKMHNENEDEDDNNDTA